MFYRTHVRFVKSSSPKARATVAVVLFLVFGSSGSGKSFSLDVLRRRVSGLAIHDFDEIGVPSDADTAWRHRATERWVRRALEYEAEGTDLLLGQTPFGELLAAPSAPLLEAISACLVDCDDETRLVRLHERGPEWLVRSAGDVDDYVNWAEWMRRHATDPAWRTDVIRLGGDEAMRWERWIGWCAGDTVACSSRRHVPTLCRLGGRRAGGVGRRGAGALPRRNPSALELGK
jgi:hypothetical protein